MRQLSSISLVTSESHRIVISASGFNTEPFRVLVVTEADYAQAMAAIASDGNGLFEAMAMPLLSRERPTLTLSTPSPGQWRIVYRTDDANVTATVIDLES